MATELLEKDTMIEGRSQAFTVESERGLNQKINLLFGKVDALKDQMGDQKFASNEEKVDVQKTDNDKENNVKQSQ